MCEDRITPFLSALVDEILEQAAVCDVDGWCRSGVEAGTTSWDDCCTCVTGDGQLWVRLIDWVPDPDVVPTGFTSGCDDPGMLTIGVGSLRCVPTLDEQGNPPSSEDLSIAAEKVHTDAQLIHSAVMCFLEERQWQGWSPLGFEGGCGGGEHVFTVPWYPCICEPTTSP